MNEKTQEKGLWISRGWFDSRPWNPDDPGEAAILREHLAMGGNLTACTVGYDWDTDEEVKQDLDRRFVNFLRPGETIVVLWWDLNESSTSMFWSEARFVIEGYSRSARVDIPLEHIGA